MNNEELLNSLAQNLSQEAGTYYESCGRNEYTRENLSIKEAKTILIEYGVCFTITPQEIEIIKDLARESINKVSEKQAEINELQEENNRLREKLEKIFNLSK